MKRNICFSTWKTELTFAGGVSVVNRASSVDQQGQSEEDKSMKIPRSWGSLPEPLATNYRPWKMNIWQLRLGKNLWKKLGKKLGFPGFKLVTIFFRCQLNIVWLFFVTWMFILSTINVNANFSDFQHVFHFFLIYSKFDLTANFPSNS